MINFAKKCSRPDCKCRSRARGMCKNHYSAWRRAFHAPLRANTSDPEILAAMPGTIAEISATCGMKYDTVRKAITRLRARDMAHVGEVQPPEVGRGHRWVSVFEAGPGVDAKATTARKRKHALARVNDRYARRTAVKSVTARPSTWLSALGGA